MAGFQRHDVLLQTADLRRQQINGPTLFKQYGRQFLGHIFMMRQPDFQFDQTLFSDIDHETFRCCVWGALCAMKARDVEWEATSS